LVEAPKETDVAEKKVFRRILILQFPCMENLWHFNFADFPVNFSKQFVSCFFWCYFRDLGVVMRCLYWKVDDKSARQFQADVN